MYVEFYIPKNEKYTEILTYMPLVICFVQFFFLFLYFTMLIYFAYYIIGIIFIVSEKAGYTRVHPCTPYPLLLPQSFSFYFYSSSFIS